MDALVDVFAQTADLALRDAVHAQRFDQIINRACRDPASYMQLLSAPTDVEVAA